MPTIRRCCIVGCMSNSRQNPQLQFFQFPRPENPFHKLWKQACQASLSRILPFKKPVVCALHFRPNCIGGRRLTSSAVPSLRLEVPQNLKAVEQQAMIEEIERSRKCAYINAVVYEWLVRANLNPQLRGSITHGMIKEKAESARQIIGSTSFIADNRWLNRFRETHLTGFAQKLSSNQLKPVGSSLWIPDIVQDLQHMFPPTNADRVKVEGVPDQYYDYMQQQYGEYEEEEDGEKFNGSNSVHEQNHMNNQYMQQDQRQQQSPHSYGNYEPYGHVPYAGGYNDYYYQQHQDRHQQQHSHQQSYQQQHQHNYHHSPPPTHTSPIGSPNNHQQQQSTRPLSRSPHQQQQHKTISPPLSLSAAPNDATSASSSSRSRKRSSESPIAAKRERYDDDDNDNDDHDNDNDKDREEHESNENDISKQNDNDVASEPTSRRSSSSSDNDNDNENENDNENGISSTENANSNGNEDRNGSNNTSAPSSPLATLGAQNGHTIRPIHISKITQPRTNGNSTSSLTNGHVTPTSTPTPPQTNKTNSNGIDQEQIARNKRVELQTYSQALEYLKPLEDFVLFKENFRAIGIISHLETVLRKARNHSNHAEIIEDN